MELALRSHRFMSIVVLALLAAGQASLWAQHGNAGNGYYPPNYAGDTFIGKVTSVDDSSGRVTLTYSDSAHNKAETFVGSIASDYIASWKDGTKHPLKPSDLPIGTKIKVYYTSAQKKTDGKKEKINTIFQIEEAPNLNKGYFTYQAR
jgi:hypothetical protein